MVGKEDLGLSLSLGPLHHHHHFLSIMPKSTSTCTPVEYWPSRPIDVNRAPTATERDQSEPDLQAGVASSPSTSPNTSAVSNSAGSGGKRDRASAAMDIRENDPTERPGIISDVEEEVDADGSRKKLRLSKDQSVLLEESFKEHNTLNQKQKLALAKQLKLRSRQVEVWFQNRRARTKLKQTEVDCEILKRCCEGLTEENRRLQKEVQELRALKIMSPTIITPPTTLTMCPSCERIISSTSAAQPANHHHHRPMPPPQPAGVSGMTWGPIPLRPSSFPQRS